jgi:hypothetical protein
MANHILQQKESKLEQKRNLAANFRMKTSFFLLCESFVDRGKGNVREATQLVKQ